LKNNLEDLSQKNSLAEIQQIKEQINVNSILGNVLDEALNYKEDVSSEMPSEDFFWKWYDGAKQVSDKEIQDLWAKVLAGEIKKPNSFSLRTIEFVKTLDKNDADLIARISHFRLLGDNIFNDKDFFESIGIRLEDLLALQELQVIQMSGLGSFTWNLNFSEDRHQIINGKRCLIFRKMDEKTYSYPIIKVTKVGKEVMSLVDIVVNEQYVSKLKEHLVKQGLMLEQEFANIVIKS